MLAWLAGDKKFLERCRQGQSPYEAHARQTMAYDDPEPLKVKNPKLYQLAKARVLGLGYGCDAEKFVDVAKALAGLELSLEESEQIVTDYRQQNKDIVSHWADLSLKLKRHVACYLSNDLEIETFAIKLPSGRNLNYFEPTSDTVSRMGHPQHRRVWGGVLCENETQAVARDIFAVTYLGLKPTAGEWLSMFTMR